MKMQGILFDIKRFAIHDGPGIRTTIFFKGCPLNCYWCHNPESQSPDPEIILNQDRCIEGCRECLDACNTSAISKIDKISVNKERCNVCGECAKLCPSEAVKMIGKEVTVTGVMKEIEKDLIFYNESGGGVTFSGGEPLVQPEFLKSLLEACQEKGIHTALDTAGYAPFETIRRLICSIDLVIYDIKLMNNKKHKKYTGVSNVPILKNLEKLSKIHENIEIRIPIVPEITDTEENINQIAKFLAVLKNIENIGLLPYHTAGNKKYERLNKENKMREVSPPSERKMEKIKNIFEEYNFEVKIGG